MEKAIGERFACTSQTKTADDDDDEDENDSEMRLKTYKPWAKLSWPFGPQPFQDIKSPKHSLS
jgi:hypothetical protein